MSLNEQAVRAALQAVIDPHTGQPLVGAKALQTLKTDAGAGAVSLRVELGYPARSAWPALAALVESAVKAADAGVRSVQVDFDTRIVAHAVQRGVQLLPGVKNIIAVASGKGGVGKSTTAANLALALAAEGARVGVLDADIYGPSQPTMLGAQGRPQSEDGKTMEPMQALGLQVMSIGFLVDNDQAMIWRGPMATQALEQLLRQTRWHDLDYLVVDMPPGTGDIQLTLSQKVPVTGAVIVTTPQDIALLDARKGVKMFEKVSVPILGVVENMAVYCCPNCGHVEHIFGHGGGARMAAEFGLAHLGELPLNLSIREQADAGCPTVAAEPDGEIAGLYKALARRVAVSVARSAKDYSARFPTITVSAGT
ncbi:ATP-binding protein involved in chromosome partitioning [Sphaerotilus hippei]|uniref:Iron-sulfur cluster carrier protein n=1 Tax=Sphaerotilus hippei TaxID=744406 RepID=A0A318GYD8_9BURK|nr:iron-sulfur cluster carrier protein ApbC [Sphaerotilus hippei]PXW93679.1 ATP-binding protein involved in chromosome partitioning [Sphaerotilus hippei]